jgi:hypothetical protein
LVPHSDGPARFQLEDTRDIFEALAEYGFLWRASDAARAREDTPQRLRSRRANGRRAARNLGGDGLLVFEADGLWPGHPLLDLRHLAASTDREESITESYANRTAQLLQGIRFEVRSLLGEMGYLGPLRSRPQRFYDRARAAAGDGSVGDKFALYLFDNRSDRQLVDQWLHRLGVPYSVDVVPLSAGGTDVLGDMVALVLTDSRTGVAVSPLDVGFGVSQVLPIVVELLVGQERVVLIEQPEIHLHPRLQTELAELLINSTAEEGAGNQVIVETHSEHLLLRLQRRIREGRLPASAVAVHYVEPIDKDGAVVKRLRLDDRGSFLDPWPEGFFEESLGELFGSF